MNKKKRFKITPKIVCLLDSYKTDGMIQMKYNIIDEIMPFNVK